MRHNFIAVWSALAISTFSTSVWAFDDRPKDSARSNPDIGVNILMLGQAASSKSEHDNGFSLQEIELQVSAPIDPYWSGTALLAVGPEVNDEGETVYSLGPEEVYVENLSLPGFSLRLGKQKLYFGKLNTLHSHAQPFIDEPLTLSEIFGEEGLNETALSVSYLAPTSWYLEIIGQVFNGANKRAFASPQKGDDAGVLYIKNLWDLNDSSTLEWLLSAASGKNRADENSTLANTAVTYKWRPTEGGRYTSFSLTGEYSQANMKSAIDEAGAIVKNIDNIHAVSVWATYQFMQSWFVEARTETAKTYLEENFSDRVDIKKQTALVGWAPTHFSAIRLQYDVVDNSSETENEHRVGVQFNFSMGAHPAHAY